MDRHRIYLRQPWIVSESREGKILQRRFHTPSGLTDRSRVWLILESVPAPADVQLNGRMISLEENRPNGGDQSVYRADITDLLNTSSNLVIIRFHFREASSQFGSVRKGSEELPGVGGKVYLEIWET